jgi:RNA polymerase sigma-70 factor (ECF subfamily)
MDWVERVHHMASLTQGELRVQNVHSQGAEPQGVPSSERHVAPLSPDDLALKAKAGDKSALEELIRNFEGAVYRLCYRILNNPVLAEDARQEAFIRMIQSIHTFEARGRFSTWLFSIATHVSLDIVRSNRVSPPSDNLPDDDPAEDPLNTCIQKEDLKRLEEALVLLAPRMRTLLALRFQEGLSSRQISKILSVSANQVRVDLFRARMALRKVLRIRVNESSSEA